MEEKALNESEERYEPVERYEPTPDVTADSRLREQLERAWYVPTGLIGWFSVVDHRTIGKRYIVTAFCFFIFAGLLAALMRIQLAVPNNHFLGPDLYNQVFTTHGTIMMFLFAVPVMEAMGIYLVPLMVGARNLAFPRLSAYSYFTYLIGGLIDRYGFSPAAMGAWSMTETLSYAAAMFVIWTRSCSYTGTADSGSTRKIMRALRRLGACAAATRIAELAASDQVPSRV